MMVERFVKDISPNLQRYYTVLGSYKMLGVIKRFEFYKHRHNTFEVWFDREHELFDSFEKELRHLEIMEKI